jgi:hypothetical protein
MMRLTLVPPKTLSIEVGLEIMADDEYLEVTPQSVRLRKQYLKRERPKERWEVELRSGKATTIIYQCRRLTRFELHGEKTSGGDLRK